MITMCLIGFVVAAAAGPVAAPVGAGVGVAEGIVVAVAVAVAAPVGFADAVVPEGAGLGAVDPVAAALAALEGELVTFACGPGVPIVAPPSHAVTPAVTAVSRESARMRAVRSRNNNVCKWYRFLVKAGLCDLRRRADR
jgi:hypothetical protein